MPEKAEVQVTAVMLSKNIRPILRSSKLELSVTIHDESVLDGCTSSQVTELIKGKSDFSWKTYGKFIFLCMGDDALAFHLRMTGSLLHSTKPLDVGRVILQFRQVIMGGEYAYDYVSFKDVRRFGKISCVKGMTPQQWAQDHKRHGLDIYHSSNTSIMNEWRYCIAKRPNWTIKRMLMEPSIVSGIGNYFASEILFKAQIHPGALMKNLSENQILDLYFASQTILVEMIDRGGVSMKDFVAPDGRLGTGVQALQVYGREGKPCNRCQTPIQKADINRSAFFCSTCQKEYITDHETLLCSL